MLGPDILLLLLVNRQEIIAHALLLLNQTLELRALVLVVIEIHFQLPQLGVGGVVGDIGIGLSERPERLLGLDVFEELVQMLHVLPLLHGALPLHVKTGLLVRPLQLLDVPALVFVPELQVSVRHLLLPELHSDVDDSVEVLHEQSPDLLRAQVEDSVQQFAAHKKS